MILPSAPLQPPAAKVATLPLRRSALLPANRGVAARPVLHSTRVPQQLCLDLQPRPR